MITVPRRYRFVVQDRDRHGNLRTYLRLPGQPKVRLHEPVGSDEFDVEYRRAITRGPAITVAPSKPGQVVPGSVWAACVSYFGSAEFKGLAPRTQRVRRGILNRFCETRQDKPLHRWESQHAEALKGKMAAKPEAANGMLRALRALFGHAVMMKLVPSNPMLGVKLLPASEDGFHTWSMAEVRQFEDYWPVGSKARLALALLLFTAQRRSDVVQFGRQHVRDGRLHFVQAKNRRRKPMAMVLPLHPELLRIIAATPSGELAFLTSDNGRPYTADSFGNRFRKWAREAGLPHCTPHGLRKAAAVRLAELGATAHELKAVLGHTTLKQAALYTEKADRTVLAASAFDRLAATPGGKVSHSSGQTPEWDESDPQPSESKGSPKCLVPRGGVEPPTLRFSIACSTS